MYLEAAIKKLQLVFKFIKLCLHVAIWKLGNDLFQQFP